jgi:hypothetical protein
MSWQAYVDNLLQYAGVNAAVLCDKAGTQVYAQGGTTATPAELKAVAACLAALQPSVVVGGQKFLVLRSDEDGFEGKMAAHGISVRKSNTLLVIAIHKAAEGEASEQSMGQKLASASSAVCEYLKKSNY